MEDAGLTYHWLLGIKLAGPFPRAHDKGVVIKQKPLLWFTKGKRKTRINGTITYADLISPARPAKERIFMNGRRSAETEQIISRLTLENQIVMDPMMGMARLEIRTEIEAQIHWNRERSQEVCSSKVNIYSKMNSIR